MNKKLMALSLGIMTAVSSMAFAAPATDLSAGKVAVDLSITNPDIKVAGPGGSQTSDKDTNFDIGITAGLGNNWDIQYKYQNSDIDGWDGKMQEFNAVYQFDKNCQAFIGMNKISGDYIDSDSKLQVGVTGTTKLGDQLSGWATLAGGSNNFSYELGLAQELSRDLDLNLFYRHKKFNDVGTTVGPKADLTVSGFGLGVTAKF